MGKKIYLYDLLGYEFYACDFEGLDANGKPRLTIMSPGHPVENFQDYIDFLGEELFDYHLLCEDGETAAAKVVLEMLIQIYLRAERPFERMAERMEEMRMLGIDYSRDLQRVKVKIHEFVDEESNGKSYCLMMYVGNKFAANCTYKDVKDIIVKLCEFFFFIENQVHIPVKKYLEVKESLKKQVMRHSTNLFDDIETI